MFTWNRVDLTKEQEKAINEEESLLLVACPGSGKTRTLTYKIASELSKLQSTKQFVIAITYTNSAADEIKDRVEILGVDTSQLWIGTIHSFCLEWILRPYASYIDDLKNGFRILNSHETEDLITTLCAPYASFRISFYDCGFIAKPCGYTLTSLDVLKHHYIKTILLEYFKVLKENKQIDFEQILYYSLHALQAKPIISSVLSKLFPIILVDEYQDTKEIQYHIIASIIKASNTASNIFIVGDPNQSIYDSLGGFPMPKKDLESLFNIKLKEYSLTANYRSSSRIIKYSEQFKCYPNEVIAAGKNKDYESLITYNNCVTNANMENEIVKLILFNIEQNISPNEICIVAPQWVHLASLTRSLMIKLPDYSFDGPGMAPFSRDIDNFWYKVTRVVLTEPSPNLYIRRLRWSTDILNELITAGADIQTVTNKTFLKLTNSISIQENDGLSYLSKFFQKLLSSLNISLEAFPTLNEHYQSFFSSSTARIERLRKDGNQFISTIENFKKVFKQREGIKISTIHGVKGCEFDTVIGFGLLEGYVPHFQDNNGILNSKKLLYVLSSRARKNLHLISECGRNINRFNPGGYPPTNHLANYTFQYNVLDE